MPFRVYREHRHTPRRCDLQTNPECAKKHGSYYRVNKYIAWTQQAPGSREGWTKVVLSICTRCQPAAETNRTMIAAEGNIQREPVRLRRAQ